MMKLWSKRRGGDVDADTDDTELDVDLESGFTSGNSSSLQSPSAATFGRSPAEERRRLVRVPPSSYSWRPLTSALLTPHTHSLSLFCALNVRYI